MSYFIGQNVKYAGQKAKVVGIISAFMEPGKMPQGIDDIPQKYLDKGIDCSRQLKDNLLLETETGLVRVLFNEVEEIKETKKKKGK